MIAVDKLNPKGYNDRIRGRKHLFRKNSGVIEIMSELIEVISSIIQSIRIYFVPTIRACKNPKNYLSLIVIAAATLTNVLLGNSNPGIAVGVTLGALFATYMSDLHTVNAAKKKLTQCEKFISQPQATFSLIEHQLSTSTVVATIATFIRKKVFSFVKYQALTVLAVIAAFIFCGVYALSVKLGLPSWFIALVISIATIVPALVRKINVSELKGKASELETQGLAIIRGALDLPETAEFDYEGMLTRLHQERLGLLGQGQATLANSREFRDRLHKALPELRRLVLVDTQKLDVIDEDIVVLDQTLTDRRIICQARGLTTEQRILMHHGSYGNIQHHAFALEQYIAELSSDLQKKLETGQKNVEMQLVELEESYQKTQQERITASKTIAESEVSLKQSTVDIEQKTIIERSISVQRGHARSLDAQILKIEDKKSKLKEKAEKMKTLDSNLTRHIPSSVVTPQVASTTITYSQPLLSAAAAAAIATPYSQTSLASQRQGSADNTATDHDSASIDTTEGPYSGQRRP